MTWRPAATRAALMLRAEMRQATRAFFKDRNVLEVETPILSAAAVSDPQIESLATRVAGIAGLEFLCPSPEYAMKRLLAAGSGDIYQLCKVFRDAERGRWHNPEFTMLEWYRLGLDDWALMDEVETLVRALLAPVRSVLPAERLSYSAALQRHAGVDAFSSSEHELREAALSHGIVCDAELDRDGRLDLLMGLVVGPRLGHERPCFICDYPASQAALARLRPPRAPLPTGGPSAVAARFELYLDGLELANGFHELASHSELRSRFNEDLAVRRARGQAQPPLDENLLAALEAGFPDCAGVALGFDRLVAIALGADRLADAMAFTIDNA
ncbi:MAG: EF-P lysine aminoacylase EpmA [Steroidobacteraceae bacterium]